MPYIPTEQQIAEALEWYYSRTVEERAIAIAVLQRELAEAIEENAILKSQLPQDDSND